MISGSLSCRWLGALALGVVLVTSALVVGVAPAEAQTVREVFQKVAPSVVVIRGRGRDVSASGQTRYTETGSSRASR